MACESLLRVSFSLAPRNVSDAFSPSSESMNLLAIDTSTPTSSCVVVCDGVVRAEASAQVPSAHSGELLSLVAAVLSQAALAVTAIDLVAVCIGPGSFTGIRIGMATARGLRLAHETTVVGVSSLDAMAASVTVPEGLVLAVLDGRQDQVFAAGYVTDAGRDRRVGVTPMHATAACVGELALSVAGDDRIVVVTDAAPATWDRLVCAAPQRFHRSPGVPGTLARFIAAEAVAGRGVTDDGTLEALYLRGPLAKVPTGRPG